MKANRYFNLLSLILITISLIACGHQEKPIDKTVQDKILKSDFSAYFDLNGNWIEPETNQHYDVNDNFQYWGRNDIPEQAIKAGITNALVHVKYLVSPEGKIIHVSTLNSKEIGKNYTDKLGFGIEDKAMSYFKVGTQLYRKSSEYLANAKPCYQLNLKSIHFGDINKWRAVEENAKYRKIERNGSNISFFEQTDSLDAFFDNNMIYPKSEIAKNISGIVQVSFYVTPDYKVLEPKIEKGINPAFDAEAMRLLNLLKKNTEPVRFPILTIPIEGKYAKDKPNKKYTKDDYLKIYTTIVFNLDKIKRTV